MPNKFDLGKLQVARAMNKYHQFYDNASYARAVNGRTPGYCNSLINECLALCGHPHYQMSNRKWSKEALEHLQRFV